MSTRPTTSDSTQDAAGCSLPASPCSPYYDHGGITIYHGDCLEIIPKLGMHFDIAFTSPPYNLGNHVAGGGGRKWKNGDNIRQTGYAGGDDSMSDQEYVRWQLRATGMMSYYCDAVFYNHKPRVRDGVLETPLRLWCGHPIRQIIIWDRGSGFNYITGAFVPQHEWVILAAEPEWRLRDKSASGIGDVWRVPPETGNPHPAPFPVKLPTMAIQASGAETILDPFGGSGTTARAAKDLGKRCVMIEKEEKYCEISAERLSQEVLPLFKANNQADSSRSD